MDENMALTPYETREILFYKTANGDVKVEILLYQENLWLTQAKMAELFEVQKAAISKHLKNIFASGELMEASVVSVLETTAADGKNYPTRYYNLDAIIAVGYRVNSKKATMFRIWANRILKEYIIKGYVMDDERLKEPESFFGKDYFEEQLERIRDIRAVNGAFIRKLRTYIPNAAQTMMWTVLLQKSFSPRCKTSCITRSQSIPQRRSSMTGRTAQSRTWG